MHSFDTWISKLESKALAFLTTQQMMCGLNGDAYDRAVDHLVKQKKLSGEALPPAPRMKRALVLEEEDDGDFVIEHLPSGPKGQTTRTKVPRCVSSS